MGNYYCMMAGLPEINLSDSMPSVSLQEVREQCEEVLNKADKQLLYYYYLHWDCQNIVKLLKNPDAELEIFGNFTMDQYQDLLTSAREMNFNVHRYPAFMSMFARDYSYNKDKAGFYAEDEMMYQYLRFAMKCPNKMIRQWYSMQLDINNILTAMIARQNGWNIAEFIQGSNEVTEMILTNKTKDFDLSNELDYVKELMKIVEEPDPVQKERRIDAFKWVWLDENTFLEPFSIESVFAYLCKLEMLHRWEVLDPEKGKETFRRIIDDLRGEAKVPDEFKAKTAAASRGRYTHQRSSEQLVGEDKLV